MTPEKKQQVKLWIKRSILGLIGVIVLFESWSIVPAGKRGVVLRLGAVNRIMNEGIGWKIPLIESVKKLDVRTQKEEIEASAASKDLQIVSAVVALNYNLMPDSVAVLWQQIGSEYKSRIIDPAIQESVKAATAKFTADELITKRPEVRDQMKKDLSERLVKEYIQVTEVSIVNFDFSESFNKAIEAKVTAEQDALASKNKLEQVKFEAEQRITQAKAEAEAIRIQAQAITQQGGENYVQLQAITKWKGDVPQYMMGSAVPFINLK